MAPRYHPDKPTGTSRFIVFCIAVWEYLFNGNFPFIDTDTVKVERGPNGYAFKAFLPGAAGKNTNTSVKSRKMYIVQLGSSLSPPIPDLLICQPVAGGGTVYVAKRDESRRYTKEFYFDNGDNVTVNYTYFTATSSDASYGDNFRLGDDGTKELQVMEKRYYTKAALLAADPASPLTQALVYIEDTGAPTGVKDPAGNDVTNIETKPTRVWIRYATQ